MKSDEVTASLSCGVLLLNFHVHDVNRINKDTFVL